MNGDIIFYQFSRSAIQEGDFTDFLKRFGKEVLPKGQQLADMMIASPPSSMATTTTPERSMQSPRSGRSTLALSMRGPTGCISATWKRSR